MSKYFTILTSVGEAKLANATALGETVKFTELALGDGNGSLPTPTQSQTSLINEVRRKALNSVSVDDDNPNWVTCEQVIPADVGGWTIREVGIYDADGDLIAVGNFPETYKPVLEEGSGRTQTIRVVLQISSTSTVELKIDPSVVLATREYVDKQDKAHLDESDPHPQYAKETDFENALSRISELGEGVTQEVAVFGTLNNLQYNQYHNIPGATLTVEKPGKYLIVSNTRLWQAAVNGTWAWWGASVLVNGVMHPELAAFGNTIDQTVSNKDGTHTFVYPFYFNAGDVLQLRVFLNGNSGDVSINYGSSDGSGLTSMCLVLLGESI